MKKALKNPNHLRVTTFPQRVGTILYRYSHDVIILKILTAPSRYVEMTETAATHQTIQNRTPLVTSDARYRAGRKLIQSGRVHLGAISMFEALATRAEEEFGDSSIEAAAIYYELGHALYLNVRRGSSVVVANDVIEEALEYMVKACSILYSHVDQSISSDGDDGAGDDGDDGDGGGGTGEKDESTDAMKSQYSQWATDQLPRILIGIGNFQSHQHKHADAVESYLNAVPYREEAAKKCNKPDSNIDAASLRLHRLLAEAHVLIAEELLMCSTGQDLVHSETGSVIVKADDVTNLAQNYYDQGKEKLQDIGKFLAYPGHFLTQECRGMLMSL